jgi:hypothetical protein
VSDTAPNTYYAGQSGNSVGELWYDTDENVLKVWDGSAWVVCYSQPTGATGSFTTSDSKTVTVTNGIITSIV